MSLKNNILIIDDDQQIIDTLLLLLKYEFKKIKTIKNPNLIPETIKKEKFDVILLDMNFSPGKTSGNEGLFWLREIKKTDSELTVVMISAYATINLAVEAVKEGAVDFILKPWENQKLIATLKSACRLSNTNKELANVKALNKQITYDLERNLDLVTCKSLKMQKVFDTIEIVSKTDANILILGENGTGKEVIAREIHRKSLRKNKSFVHVDLGSIMETLFESELFGHIKGAFTGAVADKKGRFEMVNGGSLFLDEIGNINMPLQGKLLSVIQNKEFYAVGSQKLQEFDARLICATNKKLFDMVNENKFREDLLYRINTILIELHPLRERKEDIFDLSAFFLDEFNRKYQKNCTLTNKFVKYLESKDWPGNIRELKHVIEKAVIMAQDNKLMIPENEFRSSFSKMKAEKDLKSWEDIEKFYLQKSINSHNGNLSEVARELNLSRPAIYRKIKKYGL